MTVLYTSDSVTDPAIETDRERTLEYTHCYLGQEYMDKGFSRIEEGGRVDRMFWQGNEKRKEPISEKLPFHMIICGSKSKLSSTKQRQ